MSSIATELELLRQDFQAELDSTDARLHSEPPKPMIRILLKVSWRLVGDRPWSYELGRELRSFCDRIGKILRLRTVPINSLGCHVGVGSDGRLVPCSRTRGRMLDTRKFLQQGEYRSRADEEIFLTGWNAGAKWADGNRHFCIPDKESGRLACMEPPARTRF